MNINQATDYAFRAVLFLAGQPPGKVVEAQQISRQEVIPMRFLLKIMPSLIKAGVVRSQRGVGGGYMLAKTPSEINFLDIVEAIEGPIHINRCLEDYSYCSKKGAPECQVHRALADIQQKLVRDLESHKIADILTK